MTQSEMKMTILTLTTLTTILETPPCLSLYNVDSL